MNIIIKKVKLVAAPEPPVSFVGTRVWLKIDDPESVTFGFKDGTLAEGSEKITVDWGDGTVESFTTLIGQTHVYPCCGTYEVGISDDISLISFSSKISTSEYYLKYAPMITAFQSNATHLEKLKEHCFNACVNLVSFEADLASIASMGTRAFAGCSSLSGTVRLPYLTAIVGSGPFQGCNAIEHLVFAEANRVAIEATTAYREDRKLGSVVEVEFE